MLKKNRFPHLRFILIFAFFLIFANCAPKDASAPTGIHSIAPGWASNSINAVIFRGNSITSHANTQITAFYDENGSVVLAHRTLGDSAWNLVETPFKGNISDAHNSISIMLDGAGYLHMSWDQHNSPLKYARGKAPYSLELEIHPMIGANETRTTYPQFFRMPDGNLIFLYRDGESGNGNLVMNRYETSQQRWTRVQDNLIDGEGERNAYWQATVDTEGTVHLSWVWRETWDVATNHDMCYAKSPDGGVTWLKSDEQKYTLPITQSTAEKAWTIPQNSELINQTSMTADGDGNPFIATYWRHHYSDIPQFQLFYHDGVNWHYRQVGTRHTPFSLSGGGTKRIPISRPQIALQSNGKSLRVHVIYRDSERDNYITVATCNDIRGSNWQLRDIYSESVGMWEPSYDTNLWQAEQELHLFVQHVGQGDAEGLESMPPQMVKILEWKPSGD